MHFMPNTKVPTNPGLYNQRWSHGIITAAKEVDESVSHGSSYP